MSDITTKFMLVAASVKLWIVIFKTFENGRRLRRIERHLGIKEEETK